MMSHVPDPNVPPGYAAPPKKGWFGRNWWWFIPGIVLLPICLCGGICGGGFLYLQQQVKGSGAFRIALEQVQNNDEVKQALGEPITESFLATGAVTEDSNTGGNAIVTFQVSGPKGSAMVESIATKPLDAAEWQLTRLIVNPLNGSPQIKIVGDDGPEMIEIDSETFEEMPVTDTPTEESTTEEPGTAAPAEEEPAAEEPAAEEPAETP